jgi:phosphatidylglycerol:prolipoprotein diacylglycerol transferase
MLPVLLQIGPLKLHTYGVMVVLGFLVAVNLAQRHGKRIGYNEDLIGDLAFYMMIAGLVGARTLHIIVYWNTGGYAEDPLKIIRIWEGGIVFYGGFLGAVAYFLYFTKKHQLNLWALGDLYIPSLAIGHAIGRLGCLAAGCCFGTECHAPWGLNFPRSMTPLIGGSEATGSIAFSSMNGPPNYHLTGMEHTPDLHPVQLYEAFGELTIFFILVMWRYRKRFHGQIFLMWLILYPILRWVNENFFRGDKSRGEDILFGLSTSGLISVLVATTALTVILLSLRQGRLLGSPPMLPAQGFDQEVSSMTGTTDGLTDQAQGDEQRKA